MLFTLIFIAFGLFVSLLDAADHLWSQHHHHHHHLTVLLLLWMWFVWGDICVRCSKRYNTYYTIEYSGRMVEKYVIMADVYATLVFSQR